MKDTNDHDDARQARRYRIMEQFSAARYTIEDLERIAAGDAGWSAEAHEIAAGILRNKKAAARDAVRVG